MPSKATAELLAEVQRNVAGLEAFKRWLDGLGTRVIFRNPDDLGASVIDALHKWRNRHPAFGSASVSPGSFDPTAYLNYLREQTAWIDIRGLQVGAGTAHRFPIELLYIPLTSGRSVVGQSMGLEDALTSRRLVIVGDPGSGKTTFLRRVAFALCEGRSLQTGFLDRLAYVLAGISKQLPFPIVIRIAELAEHIRTCQRRGERGAPTTSESPAWLAHFIGTRNQEMHWGLAPDFFERKMKDGEAMLLLDGLDEAPRSAERESMARLFEEATQVFSQCRFVVTTRPLAYTGRSVLEGFETARIEPLGADGVRKFLEQWCQGLFPQSAPSAERHLAELDAALHANSEIRRMASNPVMLTALAVVHWNERRLPEQRADLYESILNWLARSREKREGRDPAERCLELLQHLALGMQDQVGGRALQVSKGAAADMLSSAFDDAPAPRRRALALAFVDQEEVDSGIIVSRGSEVRFWHLTFQEYLAARAIAGLSDEAQHRLVLARGRIYRSEWREVVLLLSGVLHRQGKDKVNGLVSAVLESLGPHPSLADRALCACCIGCHGAGSTAIRF
jgi:predicted NACHT family NTPase